MQRRQFLSAMVGGTVALGATRARAGAAGGLSAGEGVADITLPLGIELAGFHKPPGQERRVKGICQPIEVRAFVLTYGPTQVALCSLDILGLDEAMARRIQRAAAGRTGIPAENTCPTRRRIGWASTRPSWCRRLSTCPRISPRRRGR